MGGALSPRGEQGLPHAVGGRGPRPEIVAGAADGTTHFLEALHRDLNNSYKYIYTHYVKYRIYKIFILGYIYHRAFQGYVFFRKPDRIKSLERREKS